MIEQLKELTGLHGPSGYEQPVSAYVKREAEKFADTVTVDGIGNVTARVLGKEDGPSTLITAHLDEVGFIVSKVEANGLLRFEKLGGHDDRVLLANEVKVRTPHGERLGVIGTISAHYTKFDDSSKVRSYRDLYIDVGARSEEEAAELDIEVGNPVTWATSLKTLGDGATERVMGKALDNRAGCAVLLETMKELENREFSGEVIALFAVQEEVGLRGAKIALAQLEFDVALAVDATVTSDTPEEMMNQTLALGKGTGIKVMDASLIAHPAIKDRLVNIAIEADIPYQLELFPGIGTDGGAVPLAHQSSPTGVLSIPSRNAHSAVEIIDMKDLEATQSLMVSFIKAQNRNTVFQFYKGAEKS